MRIAKSFNKGNMIYLGTEYYVGIGGDKEFSYFIKGDIYIIIINNRFGNMYNMSDGKHKSIVYDTKLYIEFLHENKKIVSIPTISKTYETMNYLLNNIVLKMMSELR